MLKIKNLFFVSVFTAIILPGCNLQHKLLNPDNAIFKEQSPPAYKVVLETTKGKIIIAVNRDWSPNGADRFYNLVRYGYYDNTAFFRVRDKTWAQFGIAGDAKIAQTWRNKTFADDPRKASNIRGRVAFAFKEQNGRTTQVFINLRDNSPTLDKEPFVPFGEIISGMDAVDVLYSGYGENSGGGIRAGKQGSLFKGGNNFIKQHYPELDYIIKARIMKN